MKNLLIALALFSVSSVVVNAGWTDYLYDRDYVIGYAFPGHKAPTIMTHPRVSFMGGQYSTSAHEACIDGNEMRTLSPKTYCSDWEKEYELKKSKKDEDKMVSVWTGDYVCAATTTKILRKPLKGTKEICENRGRIIAKWKKDNEDEKYNYGDYPECTLKRVVSNNATTTFKVFVAEKARKSDDNYEDDFNKNWGGYPVLSETWTVPACN
jgi:hypothetical protein